MCCVFVGRDILRFGSRSTHSLLAGSSHRLIVDLLDKVPHNTLNHAANRIELCTTIMKFWTTTLLLFLLPAAAVHATLTPSCATTTTTTSTPPAAAFFHGSMSSTLTTASSSAHLLLQLRGGGELHHPETVEDVDALILNASSNNQLVVIDFTASWYVFYVCVCVCVCAYILFLVSLKC
jgi:hypothetical protein